VPRPLHHRSSSRILRAALLALTLALLAPAGAGAQSGGTPPTGGPAPTPPAPGSPTPSSPGTTAFDGNGMWIWVLPRTEGGNLQAIIAKARRYNMRTLFIKSADGVNTWRQFTPQMIATFRAAGFKVCGWHYVYGRRPLAEAYASAYAKRQGADCFVIDAEAEYEGRYVAADQYVRKLRALVGASFPLSLAGFPYVHFHPSFPYSVFMAPGMATVNQPQMYWKAIGVSPDRNYATTYTHNRIYQRPIFPLGQTYERAPAAQIKRFRQLGASYQARGVSWWVWQQTSDVQWRALSEPVPSLAATFQAVNEYPALGLRSKGDQVVQAQLLLRSAGQPVPVDGIFGASTRNFVRTFQAQRSLPQTGRLDAATWPELLRYKPVNVRWRTSGRTVKAFPAAAGARRTLVAPAPRSASLPARAYELPRKGPFPAP